MKTEIRFLRNEELGRATPEVYRAAEKMPVVVVLDNVRSGLNVGSVFRSADSFSVSRVFLCGITAQPPEREILKSALGATETVDWQHFPGTAEALMSLKKDGYRIFAVEQSLESVTLDRLEISKGMKYALIFGNEVKGVDEKLIPFLDGCIEIPQSGTKHSLNISVCAGIVLWKFFEQYRHSK